MTFSIRLKGNMEARLDRLHETTGRPKSFYVNASLTHGLSLDELEEMYLPAHVKDDAKVNNDFGKGVNLGVDQMILV